MKNKLFNCWLLLLFISVLTIPLITFQFEGSIRDENENRMLADYPSLEGGISQIIHGSFMREVEAWINDHIGERKAFRSIYANLFHRILKISTVDTVVFGKDGWLFYTGDGNLKLCKGEYPVSQQDFEKITLTQSDIWESYRAEGKRYFLLLTPSKVTVYPEYLPFEANENRIYLIDQLEDALNAEDRLVVINTTRPLLAAKDQQELLFFKTDTHWNARGTYEAYKYVISCISDDEPIQISEFQNGRRLGDLNKMLGLADESATENAPSPIYSWQAEIMQPDEKLIEIAKKYSQKEGMEYQAPVVFHNQSKAGKGTLVLYGDSMTGEWIYLPAYLAEHYEYVVHLGTQYQLIPEIEELVHATDVIYQRTERFIINKLLNF